jgi:hypothetical protein
MLHLEIDTDGGSAAADSLTYSPAEHRWLRFREGSGTLYLETSADGLAWTSRLSTTTPWWITWVRIYLGAGTWDTTSDPGRGEFDNVNLLP